MSAREYYEVLELKPFSDGATVDQAYWHLAKTYQTQAVADPRARLLLDELNEAYGVLGTPRLREDYDSHLAELPAYSGPRRAQGTKTTKKHSRTRRFSVSVRRWNPFSPPKNSPASTTMPALQKVRFSAAADAPATTRQQASVSDLRASTSQMLERWRARADTEPQSASPPPDMTLVDIFRSENDLGSREDPLAAVMEILKAPRDVMAANSEV